MALAAKLVDGVGEPVAVLRPSKEREARALVLGRVLPLPIAVALPGAPVALPEPLPPAPDVALPRLDALTPVLPLPFGDAVLPLEALPDVLPRPFEAEETSDAVLPADCELEVVGVTPPPSPPVGVGARAESVPCALALGPAGVAEALAHALSVGLPGEAVGRVQGVGGEVAEGTELALPPPPSPPPGDALLHAVGVAESVSRRELLEEAEPTAVALGSALAEEPTLLVTVPVTEAEAVPPGAEGVDVSVGSRGVAEVEALEKLVGVALPLPLLPPLPVLQAEGVRDARIVTDAVALPLGTGDTLPVAEGEGQGEEEKEVNDETEASALPVPCSALALGDAVSPPPPRDAEGAGVSVPLPVMLGAAPVPVASAVAVAHAKETLGSGELVELRLSTAPVAVAAEEVEASAALAVAEVPMEREGVADAEPMPPPLAVPQAVSVGVSESRAVEEREGVILPSAPEVAVP